jgi:UDP-N-acetyl-D-mannosaminuronic acid dehydrogenase
LLNQSNKVCVIGLGYIGLPTAAVLATRGAKVIGVDTNEHVVNTVNASRVHIVEPDLDTVVRAATSTGNLRATLSPEPADVYLIAVPTPFKDDRKPDLTYVESAGRSVARVLRKGDLVILESTSPVGTTERLAKWLADERPDLTFPQNAGTDADVQVAYCPERVLPGRVLLELIQNDRVIGGLCRRSTERALAFYKSFVAGTCIPTDARTAELTKLTENAFRDINIAFANELSFICDRLGINVWELIALANRHPRVQILQPGPGVGGHCIAVDPWFIVDSAPEEARLIRTARQVNDSKPQHVVRRLLEMMREAPDPVVACLGLSFKADVDDLRESPAVEIVSELATHTSKPVLVVEPHITRLPRPLSSYPNVQLVELDEALAKASIIAMLVNHKPFYAMPRDRLHGKRVLDTRGVWK